jgi:hypothetical protein
LGPLRFARMGITAMLLTRARLTASTVLTGLSVAYSLALARGSTVLGG